MINSRRTAAIGVAAAALAGAGAAIAAGGDDETPITGTALDRAKAAALEHAGGGRVTETEAGDEGGAYAVEVTRVDGRQLDVHLDRRFRVLGGEVDGEREEGPADD